MLAVTASAALVVGLAQAALADPGPESGAAVAQQPTEDLVRWVNPHVGTKPGGQDHGTGGGAGNTFPGAVVPFGLMQWSPDTAVNQPGGYFYDDNRITGFSLTHLSGAGCTTYQDIPFMPVVGEVTTSPATDPDRYTATFSHDNETVTAGYYGVRLDSGAQVELTATQRTGTGRITYPALEPATLLVNTSGSIAGTDDAEVTIGASSISGWATSGRFCGADHRYRVYFHAEFDQPFAEVGTWKDGAVTPGRTSERGGSPPRVDLSAANAPKNGTDQPRPSQRQDTTVSGPGTGAYVTFDTSGQRTVTVRVGLSFVSVDGARANLAAENPRPEFDRTRQAASDAWNDRLNQIRVSGGTDEQRTTFYTALYHSLVQPNVFSDVDGRYPGFDGRVHAVERGHAAYTNFSGWDVYRSEVQLLALLAPQETSDIARSMIAYAEQGGSWDRWTVANTYTGVMNGDPYHIIVSSAYAFGARDFDAGRALLLMLRGATQPTQGYQERPGLADYQKLGYVAGAAADTLEYTSADFAIAQLARRLGDSATWQEFMRRAQFWQNLYNPATGYLQPRNRDGSFAEPFDPANPSGYVEGNGAQYTWMVPYNTAGLVSAFGGAAAVTERLDTFFTELNAGPHEPYAFLGNEPTLQTPWIYNYTGRPDRTQDITRRSLTELFGPDADGLVGNDDLGQMSSWYVWAAMGMYPYLPGRAELVLNSPLFEKITVQRPGAAPIVISAPGASAATRYVTGLKVNGQPSTRTWLPESFATRGGTVEFTLAERAGATWGTAPSDAPPSFRDGEALTQIGFAQPSRLVIPSGGSASATVGAQDVSGQAATVTWSAAAPPGLTVTPSSGRFTVPAQGRASVPVTVAVAGDAAQTSHRVPITLSTGGRTLAPTTLVVLVAEPGSLRAAFDNVGVSDDTDPALADYDGGGWSMSGQALAKAGVVPGQPVTVDGLAHQWPSVPGGDPDNVVARGQRVSVAAPAGATRLALLGSATNGKASGTLTITYTDGTTQTAEVGFSDWTLGGGGGAVQFDNRIAARTAYRNQANGSPQQVSTYVFATAPISLAPGKQVASVTLPASVTGGALHVFAITAA